MALGPVALTAAAPQRAEEEKDRSRPHHPQGSSSRAGFPFFPSFPPYREWVPLAGAVSFWPPAPISALLKPGRNRPHSIGPGASTTSSPRGISRGRFLIFFQVRLLPNTHLTAEVTAPPNPGKPLSQRVPMWLQGPHHPTGESCTGTCSQECGSDPALSLLFAGYSLSMSPTAAGDTRL